MDKNLRHWGFSRTSARRTVKDRSFRRSMTSAQTTLMAWASTVASGRTRRVQAEPGHEYKITHDVDDAGDENENQRRTAVAQAAERSGQ